MFSLTGLPSSWEQPDCSLWDNQPASQTPRPREAASPMIEGAHRDYAAVDDSANKVPDGVLGIIGNYLNPFNSELATARLSTFLREKTGADVLGNRPPRKSYACTTRVGFGLWPSFFIFFQRRRENCRWSYPKFEIEGSINRDFSARNK